MAFDSPEGKDRTPPIPVVVRRAVLVTRDAKLLQHPQILEASQRIPERFDLPTFTDAQHNMFRILR